MGESPPFLFIMSSFWYVLKVLPNKERSLNEHFNQQIHLGKLKGIKRFICPTEKNFINVKDKMVVREKVIYSGYLYFETETKLTTEQLKVLSSSTHIMGILGDRTPILLREDDVKKIIKDDELSLLNEKNSLTYINGETVTIINGPFTSFNGVVEKIFGNEVEISVLIFGKKTQINLTLDQIKKHG